MEKTIIILEFQAGNDKKYEVERIWDNVIYTRKSKDHLLDFYYQVSYNSCFEEENTGESTLTIQYIWKLISTFHKNNAKKLRATSLSVNTV